VDLTPAARRFVLHWGEMGTRWGVNRITAQVHALLLLAPEPLPADEVAETLAVARSSVSSALKELQGWRVLRAGRDLGDRRERFSTMEDPWEMFRAIAEERKRREIDPTLAVLRACLEEARGEGARGERARRRFESLLGFFESVDAWYRELAGLPRGALLRLVRAGGRLRRWAGGAR
jgi:DNA-binding transcriptional regulator GbsR (MarR family)